MSETSDHIQDDEISFEDAIGRLEAIVEKMNDQALPLDEAIELYEEGMRLSKQLTDTIESAEQKVIEINQRMDASAPDAENGGDDSTPVDDDMPF
ncbi:MAG: exodeoxyribonuclease VII small subunit [Bacteroidota bacterium]